MMLILLCSSCSDSTKLNREIMLYDSAEISVLSNGEFLSVLLPCKTEDDVFIYVDKDWIDFNASVVNLESKVTLKIELKVHGNTSKQTRKSKIHVKKQSGNKEITLIQE